MDLVIDIPEETYKALVINQYWGSKSDLENIIVNGTPLPKNHGRLIDADKLIRDTIKNPVHAPYIHIIDIKDAPTIIEGSESNDSR